MSPPAPALPPPPAPPDLAASTGPISAMLSETFAVAIVREYSFAGYRECRFDLNQDRASVSCDQWDSSRPPMSREDVLGRDHVRHIRRLLSAAELDGDPGTGYDGRRHDGSLDTLRVTDSVGRTFVLVTSGNRTFREGPRKALLDELSKRELQLRYGSIGRYSGASWAERRAQTIR